jgi:tetratricopeptide (TPR) repeat protein
MFLHSLLSINSRTTDSRGAATSAEFNVSLMPRPAACALIAIATFAPIAQDHPAPACDRSVAKSAEDSGREAMTRRDFAAAIDQFRQALSACPAETTILLELGNAHFMSQHLTEAAGIAEQVLRMDPDNAAALEIKGNVLYLEGSAQQAISTFIDLLERNPENEEAPYMLGRIYYQSGSLEKAIGQFQRLLELNPRSFKAYDNLGLCYQAEGDNDKAMHSFLTAIKLAAQDHPDYDSAYANLAELLLKLGDAEKAFGAASKAADRSPYSARNFYLGGRALEELGKIDLCLNWLQRSAALDASYPEPQYALARVYRRLGKASEAEEAQRKFLAAKAKIRKVALE